jgi:hypothetical protein
LARNTLRRAPGVTRVNWIVFETNKAGV